MRQRNKFRGVECWLEKCGNSPGRGDFDKSSPSPLNVLPARADDFRMIFRCIPREWDNRDRGRSDSEPWISSVQLSSRSTGEAAKGRG